MSRIQPMYDGIKLNVAITSDNHLDVNSKENSKRIRTVRKVLSDVQKSLRRFDAYITVGDTTSRGLTENWEAVKKCFKGFNPAENIIFTLGNHDSWSEDGYEGYADGIKNYLKYSKEICRNDIDKPYFVKIINGYHFIFLGTDGVPENEDCASLSQEQKLWFASEMERAEKSGKPVFVFCHQSINTYHGLSRTWEAKENPDFPPEIGGIGKDSDDIRKILASHKNVYYFSGHSHMALCGEKSAEKNGFATFENHDGVNFINLPCLTRSCHHGGDERIGQGAVLEVYDDKVVIRPRNFRKRKMNRKIKIQNGKPFFEEAIK